MMLCCAKKKSRIMDHGSPPGKGSQLSDKSLSDKKNREELLLEASGQ